MVEYRAVFAGNIYGRMQFKIQKRYRFLLWSFWLTVDYARSKSQAVDLVKAYCDPLVYSERVIYSERVKGTK